VVFDYYPHSVPYAAGPTQHVLGLNEASRDKWPEVAGWIAALATNGNAWVATSWKPCALEQGFRLEEVFSKTGRFPILKTKAFFPAEPDLREMENHFMRALPLAPGETAAQDKILDGSPIGLRGPWGRTRQGATWSRQGSGIVGPVPAKGGRVVFVADCAWAPPAAEWTRQVLCITPPWGGRALQLEVPAGDHRVQGTLDRPADDAERGGTGVYTVGVERPYDPAQYGLRGYAPDLGVTMRRISIR